VAKPTSERATSRPAYKCRADCATRSLAATSIDAKCCRAYVRLPEKLVVGYAWRVQRPNDPKLSDPAHDELRLQPERDGRVRCSAWLGRIIVSMLGKPFRFLGRNLVDGIPATVSVVRRVPESCVEEE